MNKFVILNLFASETAHSSVLTSSAVTDSAQTPIVQSKFAEPTTQNIAPNVKSKTSPPCDECGATIV